MILDFDFVEEKAAEAVEKLVEEAKRRKIGKLRYPLRRLTYRLNGFSSR